MNKLAKAVLRAAELREKSYDHEKAEKFINEHGHEGLLHGDFTKYYTTTLEGACVQATEEQGLDKIGAQPVYLLLKMNWNEALDWANQFLEDV